MANGLKEHDQGPPARKHDDTHANTDARPAWQADGPLIRAFAVRPNSFDRAEMTVEVVAATEAPVGRMDARGRFYETLDLSTLDQTNLVGSPVLDNHRTASVRDVVGIVQSARIDGGQLLAVIRLSQADDALPVVQRVEDGTLTGVSIGYAVKGWHETTDAQGVRVKRPTSWVISEVTLTATPADPNARIRHNQRMAPMPLDNPTPAEAETERRTSIRALVRTAGLAPEIADQLIDGDADLTRAKAEVYDAVQTRAAATPIIRTHAVANDDPATLIRRQSDALAIRMAGGEPAADVRPHLSESILDMARGALARSGVSIRGLSPDDVLQRAAHGTSDFPLVVANAMNKVALDAYQAAGSPLKSLARQRTLPDFKPSTSIRLGELGRLEPLAENGEITHTTRAEHGESFRLATYARALNVSRELMINDDLNLLGDTTRAFGEAAAATEADLMVALLTANPALSDGTAVFHATRGNTGTAAALSVGSVDAARKAMRGVKGLDGKTLVNVTPKYLLVGPEIETEAEAFLATINATVTADVNPFAGKLTLMVEPRLTGDDWFVFADPARLPTLQYGYLASAQGVQIQRQDAWNTLGMSYRAFLDFGAGWMDWRGAYYNAGA